MVYGCHIFAPLAGQGGARCGGCGGRGDTEQWRWWRRCRPGLEDTARTLARRCSLTQPLVSASILHHTTHPHQLSDEESH